MLPLFKPGSHITFTTHAACQFASPVEFSENMGMKKVTGGRDGVLIQIRNAASAKEQIGLKFLLRCLIARCQIKMGISLIKGGVMGTAFTILAMFRCDCISWQLPPFSGWIRELCELVSVEEDLIEPKFVHPAYSYRICLLLCEFICIWIQTKPPESSRFKSILHI